MVNGAAVVILTPSSEDERTPPAPMPPKKAGPSRRLASYLGSCCLRAVDESKRIGERTSGPGPLPVETVRDLLGVVRVLFAFHRAKGNHGFAKDLERAGHRLRGALALSLRPNDADANAKAWTLADEAIRLIGRVQRNTPTSALTEAVELAAARVTVRRSALVDRDAKRQGRIKRG